jgi:dipeptidyl aminopeptidase/acylaminoacyl peptidase
VFEVFEKAVAGSDARRLTTTGEMKQVTDWSRDGRHLLYRKVTTAPAVDLDIWAMPLDGDRTPSPVVRTPFEERDAQFSPDGTWIAYQSNESGQYEIYAQPFGGGGDRVRISSRGGVQARWRADGRELFYLTHDGELTAVPVTFTADRRTLTPGPPTPLFTARVGSVQGIALPSYVVSADGERFLFDTLVEQPAPPISLILNWARPGS